MKRTMSLVVGALGFVLLALVGWAAYVNVFSSDTEVRALAEQKAREVAGCGAQCKFSTIEGTRGILENRLTHYHRDAGAIVVTCKRPYIAFGAWACTATKR